MGSATGLTVGAPFLLYAPPSQHKGQTAMTRFMQLMLYGKPVAVPEDQYHTLVLRARFQASKPEPSPPQSEPRGDDQDEPAAWRGE
jgi:hypothetical protein